METHWDSTTSCLLSGGPRLECWQSSHRSQLIRTGHKFADTICAEKREKTVAKDKGMSCMWVSKMYVVVLSRVGRIYGNKNCSGDVARCSLAMKLGARWPEGVQGRKPKNAARAARGRPTAPGAPRDSASEREAPHPQSSGLGRVET